MTDIARRPQIAITTTDFERLSNLAESATKDAWDVAAYLIEELQRATIIPHPLESPRVRMGSYVYFRTDENDTVHRVRLVYPGQAAAGLNHISVLTPVGAALIGLSPGQSIEWRDRRGMVRTLTVLAVEDTLVTTDTVSIG